MNERETQIAEVLEKYSLGINAQFIPFSISRNAKEKDPSLNWHITLTYKGKPFHEVDYYKGCGHCTMYKLYGMTRDDYNTMAAECETGYAAKVHLSGRVVKVYPLTQILPTAIEVFYCVLLDSEVINYSTFEEWASYCGYNSDSRKAERTYRACLASGLALRNAIGDVGMGELKKAYQYY